jgi:uncharacterized membrane protein YeaQ/YmgE (transglycosylase-associated protein family)
MNIFGSLAGFIIIGFLAGWIAGLVMKGRGFGCIGNILIGGIGGLIGGFLFRLIGVNLGTAGFIGSLFTALVGAIILLVIAGLLNKASS